MKQLCMMNDTVRHPNAIPRTLNVVASTSNACSRSGRNQHIVPATETGVPTFTKDDRISRCPSLIAGEVTKAVVWEMAHNKQPIHSTNARRHKPRMFVDVFQIVLLSATTRQCL